jgi:hypothetical protein
MCLHVSQNTALCIPTIHLPLLQVSKIRLIKVLDSRRPSPSPPQIFRLIKYDKDDAEVVLWMTTCVVFAL